MMRAHGQSSWVRPPFVVAAALLLVAMALSGVGPTTAAEAAPVSHVKVLGWGFNFPVAIAGDAHHLYVADGVGGSIDVLALPKGSLPNRPPSEVRVWHGGQHRFGDPAALALYQGTLWVLSYSFGSSQPSHWRLILTALNAASGRVEHVVTVLYLKGPYRYLITSANLESALLIDGSDLFVADVSINEVIELDAMNGRLVRVIAGPQYDFRLPSALATIGPDVFVASAAGLGGGSVTEIDSATGALVQVIAGKQFHFAGPIGLAAWGQDLFVVNAGKAIGANDSNLPPGWVTEIDTYAPLGSPPTSTPGTTLPPAGTTTTVPTTTASTASTAPGATTSSVAGTSVPGTSEPGTTIGTSSGGPPTLPIATTTTATTTALTATSTTTATVPGSTTSTTMPLPTLPKAATLVRVISKPKADFDGPATEAVSNGQLLVTSFSGALGEVLVIDASTGALEQVLHRSSCQFAEPTVLQVDGDAVFVGSALGGVTQLRGARCVGTVEGSPYGFHLPTVSSVSDGELFVVNSFLGPSLASSVTELNARTGALSRVVALPEASDGTVTLLATAKSLYLVTVFGETLQLNATTGTVTRQFNLLNSPFSGIVTGAILDGATIYESEALGGLLSVDTITGRVHEVVAPQVASSESSVSNGLPAPMVVYGKDVFYLSSSQNGKLFIEEVDAATGKVVRVISGAAFHLGEFSQMAVWRNDLFVTDPELTFAGPTLGGPTTRPGALTEINATTGRLVARISGGRYDFKAPEAIAAAGDDLFVIDSGGATVTEVDARTGQPVRVFSGAQYDFESPLGLDVYGGHLFVINEAGDSVTDIDIGP